MLSYEQVGRLLSHEDSELRREAARFFSVCAHPPQEAAEWFWESFDRFGITNSGIAFYLREVPASLRASQRLLETLSERLPTQDQEELIPAFERLPLDFVQANRRQVLKVAGTLKPREYPLGPRKLIPVTAHMEQRLELATATPQDVWDELKLFALKVDRLARSQWDSRTDLRLFEALKRHPEFTIARSLEVLDTKDESWMRIFALDLLAELGHRPMVDQFLALLLSESDSERYAAQVGLAKMADEQIIGRLLTLFAAHADSMNRLSITETFSHIMLEASERAFLQLLDRQDLNEEDRAWIASSLVNLFTTDGFDRLREIEAKGNYDTHVLDLRDHLPTLAKAIGRELPEMAQWAQHPKPKPRGWFADDEAQHEKEIGEAQHWIEPARAASAGKVGRNDPCPCGSGKKYKKCCGK